MSLSKRLFVELSPYSLQIAVLAGDRLDACREFALDAKDALAAFAAEHAGIPVSQALLVPRVLFSNLSNESEAASIRSRSALLEYAVKAGGKLDEPVSSVVCDATTGLAPEESKKTRWLLAGTTAASVEAAKQQLAALGMPAESSSLALPTDLGAVAVALGSSPSTRVAVWQLNESDSTLWLVSSSGVEKAHALPTGFNQIFDAVQAELGLKFRTAAAKLFLNNTYDFTDLAAGIADRLKEALSEGLASLDGSPTDFRIAGLSGHQAWLGQAMAKALNLKSWSPDMAAVCSQFGITPATSASISPAMLGLLKAAGGATRTNPAWLPGWLDAQPAPVATPAPVPEAAAAPAPTQSETPAVKTQSPTAKAPGQLKVPAAAVRPQVTPTKPLATGPLTAGLKTAQVATSARTSGPATAQGTAKKKSVVPFAVAGVVVAALAVVGMKLAKGDGQAEKTQAPPAHPPIPAHTVAYYRFENGPADSKLSTQPSDTVADISPNGYHLMVYGDAFYDANVPTPTIQGAANKFSAHFKEPSNLSNIAVQSLNAYVFKDFTIEAYAKFDSLNNVQTMIGRDIDPRSNAENLGPSAIFYLQKGDNKQDPKKPDEVPNSFQLRVTTPEKKVCTIVSPVAARVNTWHHLAVVGNSAKKTLSLYVDGILVGQSTDFTGMLAPKSNSGWTFGRGQYDKKSTDWMQGSLDEIRFSNIALSPEQFVSAQAGK